MNKVLIVEDNEYNLKLFKYILEKKGYELSIARTGTEALEQIHRFKPDLVILDIQIPEINGMEVAKKIRSEKEFEKLIIIAVTAYSMRGDKEKILESGCNHYISKPIDTREFPELVEKYLNGK